MMMTNIKLRFNQLIRKIHTTFEVDFLCTYLYSREKKKKLCKSTDQFISNSFELKDLLPLWLKSACSKSSPSLKTLVSSHCTKSDLSKKRKQKEKEKQKDGFSCFPKPFVDGIVGFGASSRQGKEKEKKIDTGNH